MTSCLLGNATQAIHRLSCPLSPALPGEMNDAGEVLLTLFEHVMGVAPAAAAAVDATFGLSVSEHVQCSACCKVTQQSSYTQFFYNTQVRTSRLHLYQMNKQHWPCLPDRSPCTRTHHY